MIILETKSILNVVDLSSLSGKRILVTGATGLIGIYLISSLKNVRQVEVFAWINNDIPNYFIPIFESCKILKGDLNNPLSFNDAPKFDVIIHAAGYGQPNKFTKDKIKTIQINTTALVNLFKLLKEGGKFLFLSSSEVYNGLDSDSCKEEFIGTTNTDNPRACYIEGKRCGEALCHSFKELGFDVKIARISLAYGPGVRKDDERVINCFIKKAILQNSINLLDEGSATRTYCYITDAVEMLLNILLFGRDSVYNIGGKSSVSVLEMAQKIGLLLNKPISVPKINKPILGGPKIVKININRYLSEFNKKNFESFEFGLEKTISWYNYIL